MGERDALALALKKHVAPSLPTGFVLLLIVLVINCP